MAHVLRVLGDPQHVRGDVEAYPLRMAVLEAVGADLHRAHGHTQWVRVVVTADVLRVTKNPEDMRHVFSYDIIMDGIGLMDDGSLAIDTATPAGAIYVKGFRMSPLGAVYGEDGGTPVNYLQGVAVTAAGAIAYVLDDSPDVFVNGNPVLHTGELTVEAAA